MYAKLAWRNMRRSLRDYGIYFMTLVFAVAIFYVFNSLGDQPAFLNLGDSKRRMAQGAVHMMEWITTVMSGVVALLVLYANRVIVKKRNRELGTYLLLGTEQGRLSLLLLAEMTVIGFAALMVGLAGGVLLSQFFALVVNRVFGADPQGHGFIFSADGAFRTVLYYGVMFVVVGLLQAAVVYRQRLIDLINGVRKNEEIRLRSRPLALVAGVLSALALGRAYWLSDQVSRTAGLDPTDPRILSGAALGVIGTFLLFVALAGLLSGIRRKQGGWLSRGLNLFLYRQVTSKINTNATLLATIALMLTFTICAMSTGLGIGETVRIDAERQTPFDYVFVYSEPGAGFGPVLQTLDEQGVAQRQAAEFITRKSPLRAGDLMLPDDAAALEAESFTSFLAGLSLRIVPFSAYSDMRAMKGYEAVTLPEDGFLIHTSALATDGYALTRESFTRFQASGETVSLAGQTLRPVTTAVFTEALGYNLTGVNSILVVPDQVAQALEPLESYLVLQVGEAASDQLDQALLETVERMSTGENYIGFSSRNEASGSMYMVEGILVFLSFYVGIMFILISATLLALQQVTDAVEHRQRFEVLRKLGADGVMVDRTIAKQVGLYFMTPVAVALVHSVVALIALNRVLLVEVGFNTVWSAFLVTMSIFAAVYGAYYLLSLQTCRNLFKHQQAW